MQWRTVGTLVGLVVMLVVGAWILIQLSTPGTDGPNESGEGPRADEALVTIAYPADMEPLGGPIEEWVAAWDESPLDLPTLEVVETGDDGSEVWAAEVRTDLAVALDLGVRDGMVEVAQLSAENAQGAEDDAALVDEVIPRFLGAAGAAELQAELGLDNPEELFGEDPREATARGDGVVVYLAMNEFSLVLGVVGDA